MSLDHKFGKNKEYNIGQVKTNQGAYKTKYAYIEKDQSIILLSNQDFAQYEQIMKQIQDNKKTDKEHKFNLKTKIPTNLTKAQRMFQEKMSKTNQGKAKNEISVDQVPSQIHDGTFNQCFNCVDKNVEIMNLHKQNKIWMNQNSKLKQQRDQLLLRGNKNNLLMEQLTHQNEQFQRRVLILQDECNKLKKIQKIQRTQQKLPPSQYIDEIMQKQKELKTNIKNLEQENFELKKSNYQKDNEIKELRQSTREHPNPQNNVNFKKKKNDIGSFISSEQIQIQNDDQAIEIQLC